MSTNGMPSGEEDVDSFDYQTSYIFTPTPFEGPPLKSKKRRKISKSLETAKEPSARIREIKFPPLLDGNEVPACVDIRRRLFEESWASTERKIQLILREANEITLESVTQFVNEGFQALQADQIPTGLVVTGPNIASQELLFGQISEKLQLHACAPVVVIRSGDANNLKTILKKIIRDTTNHKDDGDDYPDIHVKEARKMLNYDLQILHLHIKSTRNRKVVVAFQDSEAFDGGLLAEVITLLSSWLDRIPFILLFGIATSVQIFQERLSRGAVRCLHSAQFNVEQTNLTLGRVFQKAVAGNKAPLLLGPGIVSLLLERQQEHVQSLQAFVGALKYAYMCHFYANPLSIFLCKPNEYQAVVNLIQPDHLEAVRILPSFRQKVETLLSERRVEQVQRLLNSDEALLEEIQTSLNYSRISLTSLRQKMHVYASIVSIGAGLNGMELYLGVFSGQLGNSSALKEFLESIKMFGAAEASALAGLVKKAITNGDPRSDLHGWADNDPRLVSQLSRIEYEVQGLERKAQAQHLTLRSRYTSQGKILRTTIVAHKVQLSKETSSLSDLDISYSDLLDELVSVLESYLKFGNPQDLFLHEIWFYDSQSPYREAFTPKSRHVIERALSIPHDYLGCSCCKAWEEGLSASQPPTAILYQLYLETGNLINVFDLWSAFYTIIDSEDGEDCDERSALALFYTAVAGLKQLGMVKQGRKKTDHLSKLIWKGL